jgi:twitching motility protein PilT
MDLNGVLSRALELGASDVHLKVGRPPVFRRDGSLRPLSNWRELAHDDLMSALEQVTAFAPARREAFHDSGELDIAYQVEDLPRMRVNAFRQRGAISLVFRLIPTRIPSLDELSMPPGVQRLAEEHRGLILVTGATGAGKSTTLAAIVDYINREREQHIVTIEDPIEVLHSDHKSIVNQREIGLDTGSFSQALRRAVRQDPDVILIGELRDAETAETALQASESGHLVLSTMHTVDAAETIGRLIEFFPAAKQPMTRSILAGVLKGVVSQRLLVRAGGGRVAAVEVMITNDRIADLILENKADEISNAIADGRFYEMQTFSQALIDLVLAGAVERAVAATAAPNRHDFLIQLEQAEKMRAAAAVTPSLEAELQSEESASEPAAQDAPLRLVRLPDAAAHPPSGG